jgi:outer membrane protein TolC
VTCGCATPPSRLQVRDANASADLEAYGALAPDVTDPLTLADALHYAVRHNIEVWIAAQEREYRHELATQSLLKMLPSLLAGAESSRRSRFDAASSVSLESGSESLEPSYSSEKQTDTWNISTTWNLLDFGLSFLRSRQQANRVQIAAERERRVKQNLALEVTRAYWQAVTARAAARQVEPVAREVAAQLERIRREIDDKAISQIVGLKRQTLLLEQQETLRRYERSYLAAKAELATLIGLSPGAEFTLADVDLSQPVPPLAFEVAELEREALRSRPELFEKDLEQAISRDEVHVALAQMFPSVSLFWRYDDDNNRYLAFGHWNAAGIRASWDLLALPQQIKQREAVKLQTELIAKRRIAVAIAILTQLHLALIDYQEALGRCQTTRTISETHERLLTAVENAAQEGKSHGGDALDQRMKYVRARAKHLSAYADLMVAQARMIHTLGREPHLEEDDNVLREAALPKLTQALGHANE